MKIHEGKCTEKILKERERIGNRLAILRKKRNMTQEELAQKIGVQRSQISKIESGRNLTLSTIARVFKAMGMKASLSISGLGSITL